MLVELEKIKIENMIYEVRGKQVMLDSDLAKLYGVETKRINEAVKNNPEKFPERFSFRINSEESTMLLVEKFDQKIETRGGRFNEPRVFTEQGVAMLATILKSKIATKVSIDIMDAFVLMRKYISGNLLEQRFINEMVLEHDSDLKLIHQSLEKLETKELINEIYFQGQIYDAYSKIVDILNKSENEIILIDAYADKSVLDIIRGINVPIKLIVKKDSLLKEIDIEKYKKQYNNLTIIYDSSFHDRYFILDRKEVYHCGTSLNYAGSKTFSINKIEDEKIILCLIEEVIKLL